MPPFDIWLKAHCSLVFVYAQHQLRLFGLIGCAITFSVVVYPNQHSHQRKMGIEDMVQATTQLEDLDIARTTQHHLVLNPPRASFPLPRELRDIMYTFLLKHDNVRGAPFHTRKKSRRGKVCLVPYSFKRNLN